MRGAEPGRERDCFTLLSCSLVSLGPCGDGAMAMTPRWSVGSRRVRNGAEELLRLMAQHHSTRLSRFEPYNINDYDVSSHMSHALRARQRQRPAARGREAQDRGGASLGKAQSAGVGKPHLIFVCLISCHQGIGHQERRPPRPPVWKLGFFCLFWKNDGRKRKKASFTFQPPLYILSRSRPGRSVRPRELARHPDPQAPPALPAAPTPR